MTTIIQAQDVRCKYEGYQTQFRQVQRSESEFAGQGGLIDQLNQRVVEL